MEKCNGKMYQFNHKPFQKKMVTLLRNLKMKNLNKLNPLNMVLLVEPSIMGGQNNDKHDNHDENAGNETRHNGNSVSESDG